ncbi:enoyl-CoA hydratase/isomerase family protein [Nocardioides campestrisoli]|uniref:enoyl-CoA hydratase/isomerase family protein n=1 Tax=Nocardioides campestrisoli TaxID=2736757 RepID=UPI001C62862B|nr:enoyl-CoA hydratase/isomerase family protein [Nocardioides campestrisoli]
MVDVTGQEASTQDPSSQARTWETLGVSVEAGVAEVRLARADRLNALSSRMRAELAALWRELAADPSVRVVVVTGEGRAFSAGADFEELAPTDAADAGDARPAPADFVPSPVLEVPVLVAVNGLCLGGALRFVADADVVLAAEDAWFSDPHVSLGQTSGPCALGLAARAGSAAVAPLALAGAAYRMDARQAQAVGLVSEVVPSERLLERAHELARMIAVQSPTAVRRTLALLRRRTRAQVEDLMPDAWAAIDEMWAHPDVAEASDARAEGRPPVWADPVPSGASSKEEA